VCHLHRTTVARAVKALLVRRAIYETKKRRGTSGQVKVYRMPKITYESGLKSDTSSKGQSVAQVSYKCRTSVANKTTNLDPDNREPNISDSKALGNSLAEGVNKLPAQESKSFSGSYQNHIKWGEFASWCEKKDGKPT